MNRYSYAFKLISMHTSDKGIKRANTISNSAVVQGLKVLLLNHSHTDGQYDYYLLGVQGEQSDFDKFKRTAKELGAVHDFSR